MAQSSLIKPTHKSITQYHQTLADTAAQGVEHEMAVRRAFRELLAATAKTQGWTIIEEETHTATDVQGKVRPDATFRDKNTLPRGYWEAKDSADDLDAEIRKKKKKGYSLVNTIFEDTRIAVLYQNAKEAFRADLTKPQDLADILNQFLSHTEPDFERWDKAVDDFKDRVPELAKGLVTIVETAHRENTRFKKAFGDFFALCQTALNPNISQAAVDEMLIQHILTERLFRTIFNRADFTQRNVIAAEVEKVITALTSQSFSREEYLKGLDRFYLAIENAARHLEWSDKQHFLNVIYERFFQGYSIKTADTMGIVYTPQPIVDFMCASVTEILKMEFKKELGDPDVFILDPCTGTGNFIVNLLKRVPPRKLSAAYTNNLFANEIMLMPYYIAALNVEHAHYELSGRYEPFEGLCFVDTLDIAEHHQNGFDFFTQKNTERVERQKRSPITVVIGNPPYNANQVNDNDNNKNRAYPVIDARIKHTYVKANSAQKTKLYDPYVRFFRWATDRLNGRDGIVCLVTNNSFVHQTACDGLQRYLAREFSQVYHLDLRGNVRRNPKLSGTAYNVFGIQVGVGITIAIRNQQRRKRAVKYRAVPLESRRHEKLALLARVGTASAVPWKSVKPDDQGTWMIPNGQKEFAAYLPLGSKAGKASDKKDLTGVVFRLYSLGVSTNRDDVVYGFVDEEVLHKCEQFAEGYNAELDRLRRSKKVASIDTFVDYSRIKWSATLKGWLKRAESATVKTTRICRSLYRPFSMRSAYYAPLFVDRPALFSQIFPSLKARKENQVICVPVVGNRGGWSTLVADCPVNLNLTSIDGFQCFPFYVYGEDGSNRENITDWALHQFRTNYKDKKITKWDIFYYVYGLLHHPGYRGKFADNLKRELPRIPFAPDFRAFAKAGKKLADLHLNYESAREYPLKETITPGTPRSPRVTSKMKLSKNQTAVAVNDSLTLTGIPSEVFEYKLGNRSALEWIVDQYQVYTDKRTGITGDPNAWGEEHGNPEYIVQLIARVITVSLETLKIVDNLPKEFAGAKVHVRAE